jgi:rhamnosyl/mannosyltransferase
MANLRALHAELRLGDRVTLAGHVDDADLPAHIAAADVGVLPSNHPTEGFGLSMVETMAGGVPVVCTELGTGTSFVNRDGESGLVVPPNDPTALAAALDRVLNDAELRARLGAGARARAEALFSKEAMLRNTMAVYEEALARPVKR